MNKCFLLLTVLLMGINTKAQPFYTHETFMDTYTDLENSVSVNLGQIWTDEQYGPFEVPFNIEVAGETITHFAFDETNFIFLTGLEQDDVDYTYINSYIMRASGMKIKDRENEASVEGQEEVSVSPISYKVEGIAGSRILKMEVKNSGAIAEQDLYQTNNLFVNFQVWIYEGTNVIEYRYGNTNFTGADLVILEEDEDFVLIGITKEQLGYGCFVYQNPETPDFTELNYTDEEEEEYYTMTFYPANGRVYRFNPTATAGTGKFDKTQFNMYPNPVTGMLNISLEKMDATDYIITDMTGKTILMGNFEALENTLDLQGLTSGMYFIKIGNATQKFLKK